MGFNRLTRRSAVGALLFLLAFTCPLTVLAQSQDINALKAAYIFNFSKFVDWRDDSAEIVICLDTENRWIFRQLKGLEGKTVNSKPFRVQTLSVQDIDNVAEQCHVLYRDNSIGITGKNLQGVLVVGDVMDSETIIAFVVKQGRLTFEIDADRAEKQGVEISSRLLRLARKVYQ